MSRVRPRRVLIALENPMTEFEPSLKRLKESGLEMVEGYDLGEEVLEDRLVDALDGIWGVLAGGQGFTRSVLARSGDLGVIARLGVGFDQIDVAAATENSIAVTITPTGNAAAVADFAVGLMLAVLRQIPAGHEHVLAGGWRGQDCTRDLSGATVGILGLGRIGRKVARRLVGFDCKVLAVDPMLEAGSTVDGVVEVVEMGRLLDEVDVLTLHLPLTDETRGVIGPSELARLKQGAVVINTARGPLIDEVSLVEQLESGHLGGVGLDVFEVEPLPLDSPIRTLPNVVLSGHVAAQTSGAMAGMMSEAVDNVVTIDKGQVPPSCVNPEAFKGAEEREKR
ncbi:MAG: phosphoglycerate dehydrogenase [Acidimicrobiia bacterium]